jgi:hypothetical protein
MLYYYLFDAIKFDMKFGRRHFPYLSIRSMSRYYFRERIGPKEEVYDRTLTIKKNINGVEIIRK